MKCQVCGAEIRMTIMKGSGVCSENCRKIRDGEITPFSYTTFWWMQTILKMWRSDMGKATVFYCVDIYYTFGDEDITTSYGPFDTKQNALDFVEGFAVDYEIFAVNRVRK